MSVGYKVSQLLEIHNSNPNELAKKLDIPPQTIYSIIKRDSTRVDIDVLSKISRFYDVPLEYFITDNNADIPFSIHFDSIEYNEDQLKRIMAFAKFIKQEDSVN